MPNLYESELKIMNLLWEKGEMAASDVAKEMGERVGWNKNTTYTMLNKLAAKGIIARSEPKFSCRPLISREEAQKSETDDLIEKMFDGSKELFLSAFLQSGDLTKAQVNELKKMMEEMA